MSQLGVKFLETHNQNIIKAADTPKTNYNFIKYSICFIIYFERTSITFTVVKPTNENKKMAHLLLLVPQDLVKSQPPVDFKLSTEKVQQDLRIYDQKRSYDSVASFLYDILIAGRNQIRHHLILFLSFMTWVQPIKTRHTSMAFIPRVGIGCTDISLCPLVNDDVNFHLPFGEEQTPVGDFN